MRIRVAADVSGHIRLSLLPEAKRASEAKVSEASPLVYSKVLQDRIYPPQKAHRPGYGTLGRGRKFGSVAKGRLRECGSLLDNGPLKNCAFLTGTLPGGTAEAKRALAEYSGWVVALLSQWLRDTFPCVQFFGVWEYQKRGALHIHVCVRVRRHQDARLLRHLWKKRWISLLDAVKRKSGVDVYQRVQGDSWERARWAVRTDAQEVEQSVARYLSKYCGKSADKRRKKAAFPPVSWWFASDNLRELAKENRWVIECSSISLNLGVSAFEILAGELAGCANKCYPVFNRWDIRQRGLIAFLAPPAAKLVRQLLIQRLRTLGRITGGYKDSDLPTCLDWCAMFSAQEVRSA